MYGFAAGETVENGLIRMNEIIEKPGKDKAPSELASVSAYLLPGAILKYIEDGSGRRGL